MVHELYDDIIDEEFSDDDAEEIVRNQSKIEEAIQKVFKETQGDRCKDKILELIEKLITADKKDTKQRETFEKRIDKAAIQAGQLAGQAAGNVIREIKSETSGS